MPVIFHVKKFITDRTRLNKIIVLLTLTDVFTWGTHMIIIAITGIYLSQRIEQNVVQIVGIGTAIYTASRGILQLPIGRLLDKWKFDNDEIIFLSIGNILMGSSYLFYPFISSADLYYALQFIFAIGAAMNLIAWKKLFAQNIDKHNEGVEYGEYGFVMGITSAVFGIFAGTIANLGIDYFNMVIVGLGVITMLGSVFSLSIFKVKKRKSRIW